MKAQAPEKLKIVDSHTGGEPTRVVIEGCPDLGFGPLSERRDELANRHDWVRTSCLLEPRGFEAMVGAVLVEPHESDCVAGVIFFNNAGYLNMCIHGTIGLAKTLEHMGVIGVGRHRIDTPVGVVTVELRDDASVTVDNVPSYLYREDISVEVEGVGLVRGDLAWGGNWFFLVDGQGPEVRFENVEALSGYARRVLKALESSGVRGEDGGLVDHVELFGPPADAHSDSRNFVMCPGGEYDRSPCGTGTSAKLACLFAKGVLKEGELWRQASILNTVFVGKVTDLGGGKVLPSVTGSAWVNGESTVIIQESDPFAHGIYHTQ
ncbi:proline racemase family protein [Rubritalea tangerina]|uniref:Proline racemase family protein n=1 Tax=Rubritalea tangerina TaxID=430798 RepID=A0ABW4Z8Y0_9BACT